MIDLALWRWLGFIAMTAGMSGFMTELYVREGDA